MRAGVLLHPGLADSPAARRAGPALRNPPAPGTGLLRPQGPSPWGHYLSIHTEMASIGKSPLNIPTDGIEPKLGKPMDRSRARQLALLRRSPRVDAA
jgi:hypothetical protein